MIRIVASPEQLITSDGPGRHVVLTSQVFERLLLLLLLLMLIWMVLFVVLAVVDQLLSVEG